MKKQKRQEKNEKKFNLFILSILLLISLLSISVGFSALSTTLSVNGTSYFSPVDMIRVLSFKTDTIKNARESSKSFTIDEVSVLLDIDELDGSITYDVNITNLGQVDKVLDDVISEIFSNDDMTYEIIGLSVGDVIKKRQTVDFKIKFRYKDGITNINNTSLNSKLKFKFSDYHTSKPVAYIKQYNGKDSFFGFDKNDITSFSRNTSLTLDEVKNKSGVKLISNTSSDEYNSLYEIYAYLENGNLYWWSEAETVAFHPKTLKAFANLSNIVSIDLTGMDTSKVENFSHWFDTDRKLKKINGIIITTGLKLEYNDSFEYANDSDENSSSEKGLTYMFNDCNALESVDLSGFVTTNASDMKRMFGGCKNLKKLDLSNFDTSNVKSMYWMFRNCTSLTSLNLHNFNTQNVLNTNAMFLSSSKMKVITFGDNFKTNNVKDMSRMFEGLSSLTTIYASQDFVIDSNTISRNMFSGTNNLVGAKDTTYEKKYDSNFKDATYAKIASPTQEGYFTQARPFVDYTIIYSSNGGTGVMKSQNIMFNVSDNLLNNTYTREGYTFRGWNTKADGTGTSYYNKEEVINITENSSITLYAMWIKDGENAFTVFRLEGPCTFTGTGNDCTENPNQKYIDTKVKLYDSENYNKDFEIYLEIDSYSPENQTSQATLINAKLEDKALGYPGLAFRTQSNDFELTQTIEGVKARKQISSQGLRIVHIIRKDNKIYYSINNSKFTLLQDMSNFKHYFDNTVWFGSSVDANGSSFRPIKATISNMYIRLGKLDDNILN